MLDGDREILTALREGKLTVQGEFLWGSNYTFLVEVAYGSLRLRGVYKPTQGERPLWDFPRTSLARREVAAYLISEALGWCFVPPTVYRRRAPLGAGSIQCYIEHNPEYHYFRFSESDRQRLRPVALFDLLINNADRKGSHILIDPAGKIWLIDHGICFHREDKLRTVIWDFAGEPISEELLADLERFRQQLETPSELLNALQDYLHPEEIAALTARTIRLLAAKQFPHPHPNRRVYPYPPI